MRRIPCVLTIAGSDSCGGAGIQADLKTFTSLGVHGISVVTSITAQNTISISSIHDLEPNFIKSQIKTLLEDIQINAVKTGMLHTSDIIEAVSNELKNQNSPIVVDPVMRSKSGSILMDGGAEKTLVDELLPLSTVVTPNIPEAEALSKIRIRNIEDVKKAAKEISKFGAKTVVIKGGHLPSDYATDVLFYSGKYYILEADHVKKEETHGTGCVFSSAIAAELAKEKGIHEAVRNAKKFMSSAIKYSLRIGSGPDLVNPIASLQIESERYFVMECLKDAVNRLEGTKEIANLVPEVQMNITMAISDARNQEDVAGIKGRIVKIGDKVKSTSCPEFGASTHVANTVLAAMRHNASIKSGMNIKYSNRIIEVCDKLGFKRSLYDRTEEPNDIKNIEGKTTLWGAEQAIEKAGFVPDIVYHKGSLGKEPMITIFAPSAIEVVEKAIKIAKSL